jgi:O-antigen/teichoic acid export membrane protein
MSGSSKNHLLTNAIWSVVQIFTAGACLFLLFRFLLTVLGVERLGIWSLVLATTSVTQVANIGLSGGTVRFVAKYRALKDDDGASSVVQTAAISIGFGLVAVLVGCYPLVRLVLSYLIPLGSLPLALEVLPFAMVSIWLTNVAAVFIGGLEGCQRFDIRGGIQAGGMVLQLVFCVVLAPKYGLPGVAYAVVLVNFAVLLASWLLLKRFLPSLSITLRGWNFRVLKELAGYGIGFQVITLFANFYDPVTKGLVSRFGDLASLGYYEMASRLVTQVRMLVVAVTQVTVPHFANLLETSSQDIPSVYRKLYNLLLFLSLPLFTVLVVGMPFISVAWIGHYERMFVFSGVLLSGGWFINSLNAPAYFLHLGTGELKWNLISHVMIGLLNIALGFIFGTLVGGGGPVIGWAIALTVGSCFVLVPYHKQIGAPVRELVPKESVPLALVAAGSIIATTLFGQAEGIGYAAGGQALVLSSIVVLFAWIHPARRMLFDWFSNWRTGIVDGNPI